MGFQQACHPTSHTQVSDVPKKHVRAAPDRPSYLKLSLVARADVNEQMSMALVALDTVQHVT